MLKRVLTQILRYLSVMANSQGNSQGSQLFFIKQKEDSIYQEGETTYKSQEELLV